MTNVISTASQIGLEDMGAYAATKWGLLGLTKCLIKEARPYNIRVTTFSPGGTDIPFRAERRPHYLAPDTVAEAILSIASLPENAVVHDLVLRPIVETNFQGAMGPVRGHPGPPRRNWRARRALPGICDDAPLQAVLATRAPNRQRSHP